MLDQLQGTTNSKDRACHLNAMFTSLKLFLFAKSCVEFLGIMQRFSKVFQYDDLTIDGVTQKFTATKERLHNMLSTLESSISK